MSAKLSDILELSVLERIQLVEDIWDSIAMLPEAVPLTVAERQELKRRLETYSRNSNKEENKEMADISILKIDEGKSRFSDSNPYYVLVLSGKPDQNWKNNLATVFAQSKNSKIMNLKIENSPGNQLTLNVSKEVSPEQMLETVQGLIAKVNSHEDEFKNKIREINKKLAATEAQKTK